MNRSWVVPTKKAGRKHVCHARGLVEFLEREPKLAARSDIIVPISDYVAESVPEKAKDAVLRINDPIVPVAPDADRVAAIRAELTGGEDVRLVGLFPRLDQQRRNIRLFCNVANRLSEMDGAPVKFVICGRGEPETLEMIRNIAFEAKDRLEILGFVDPPTDYMAAMDCIVAPAKEESLGRTPLEAGSVGVPTIALGDGGHLETVIDGVNGFLVPHPHSDAFAYAIQYALHHDKRHDMTSRASRRHVSALLARYDPDVNARKLLARYETVLGRQMAA